MQSYKFDGYTIKLQETTRRDELNHIMVYYQFLSPEGDILFSGDDLGTSPLHEPEGLENAKALLSFLTLKPGDTDDEYFENYTQRQIEFTQSMDIENLAIYCDEEYNDFESKLEN